MLSIARQMRAEGHIVVFACFAPENIKKLITADGFRLISIRLSPLQVLGFLLLPFTSGYMETFIAIKLFFSGLSHYARAIGHILDELQPDEVVSDFAFLGSCLAAESRNIPYAIVYHAGLSLRGHGIPPFGSGLPIGEAWGRKGEIYRFISDFLERNIDNAIARARKRLKLPLNQKSYLTNPSSPWLTLMLTAEACEAPRFPLSQTAFFIGHCFTKRQNIQTNDFPFDQLSENKPKIYVSLGTVFNKKPKIFNKIINAFADDRYQLVVSAGGAFTKLRSQNIPSNVLLFGGNLPQVEILSRVDVVISHGGNNTVNETLAAGKPLLVMPVGGEQGDNGSRVVYLGVGLRLDIKQSTSQEIGAKVKRLIEEPTFRQCAKEVADALTLTQGPVTAARFIERVAQSKQPLLRPKGYPLTVTRETVPPWEWGN
jgi:MGT family glycosyltransferase